MLFSSPGEFYLVSWLVSILKISNEIFYLFGRIMSSKCKVYFAPTAHLSLHWIRFRYSTALKCVVATIWSIIGVQTLFNMLTTNFSFISIYCCVFKQRNHLESKSFVKWGTIRAVPMRYKICSSSSYF